MLARAAATGFAGGGEAAEAAEIAASIRSIPRLSPLEPFHELANGFDLNLLPGSALLRSDLGPQLLERRGRIVQGKHLLPLPPAQFDLPKAGAFPGFAGFSVLYVAGLAHDMLQRRTPLTPGPATVGRGAAGAARLAGAKGPYQFEKRPAGCIRSASSASRAPVRLRESSGGMVPEKRLGDLQLGQRSWHRAKPGGDCRGAPPLGQIWTGFRPLSRLPPLLAPVRY